MNESGGRRESSSTKVEEEESPRERHSIVGMSSRTDDSEGMQVNAQRAKQLAENISHVIQQVRSANQAGRNVRIGMKDVLLACMRC